jgi:topoisomerase IA-like protein
MQKVMHEYKHHELESGRSHKKVKNPKQAIAIGLSEARRSGANIPPNPSKKKAAKKSDSKKAASKKTGSKKSGSSKKSTSKKSASKK